MTPAPPHQHPANAPGGFYVVDGCCTGCEVPFVAAPELFAWDRTKGYPHCFVKRQPATPEEVGQMMDAVAMAELACIRYGGTEPALIQLMVRSGNGWLCDQAGGGE